MKPSPGHIEKPAAAPSSDSIPAPVQLSTVLPKPRPVQKPETYSVVVNGVKVQELLFALARDAKLNVDIHSGISGTVTLNAIDQTLPQLLQRISKQVDMRWELDGPNLVVLPDMPYLRVYKIDYVNMERTTTGIVGVSSQISGGAAGGGAAGGGATGGAAGNTSTTTLRNQSSNHFWRTLEENVKDILRETDKVFPGSVTLTPAAPGAPGAGAPPGVPAPAAPGSAPAPGGAAAQAPSAPTFREAASVIANPEAGILTIRATARQHERIQEFLDVVMSSAKRQVLIEATIVEVQLNSQFQRGIDWSLAARNAVGGGITFTPSNFPGPTTNTPTFTATIADPRFRLGNLSAAIRLLEGFGNVRVLSSPKLSVLNNQTAILKVVDEVIYFNVQVSQAATGTAGTVLTTFNTTPQTVPVGFVMNVTPQIGDTDTVLLNLRPSLTRVTRFVADPNPSLGAIQNLIPEIQRREMESIIKVNSGQIAVMGGLIEERLNDSEAGIPGVTRNSGPFAPLFGQRNRANNKTELVVFLRPVVVRDPSIDGDYRAFRVYAPDQGFMNRPHPQRESDAPTESNR